MEMVSEEEENGDYDKEQEFKAILFYQFEDIPNKVLKVLELKKMESKWTSSILNHGSYSFGSPTEVLTEWRGGDESVICDGILYFLIYSAGGGVAETRHGLIMFDLSSRSSHGLLIRSFIKVPCPLTCGRLMNLNEKLVMVGGIGKHDQSDVIKGIGIWVLNGKDWQEISRMPHKFFQEFGSLMKILLAAVQIILYTSRDMKLQHFFILIF